MGLASQNTEGLTSEALSKLPHDQSAKALLVKAFVSSQNKHSSAYLTEGKKEFLRWQWMNGVEDSGDPSNSKYVAKTLPIRSGFSSPPMKPRNSRIQLPLKVSEHVLDSDELLVPGLSKKQDASILAHQSATGDEKASEASIKSAKKPNTNRKSSKDIKKTIDNVANVTIAKRKRSNSDNEREERLAQRRARRKRKRLIVAPKSPSEVTATEEDKERSGRIDGSRKGKGKKPSGKKDLNNRLPAGLALMHGFSANNIGKDRITVCSGAAYGVFGKGRASTGIKATKKSTLKAIFSESDFLGKISSSTKSSRKPKSIPKSAITIESQSSTVSSDYQVLECKKPSAANKPSAADSAVSENSSAVSSSPSSQQVKSVGYEKKSNYESEVWEIEREFLLGPDPARLSPPKSPKSRVVDSKTRDQNSPKTTRVCSKIMPALGSRSTCVSSAHENKCSVLCDRTSRVGSAASSLTPSQSASQVWARVDSPTVSCSLQVKSKFFASPALKVSRICKDDVSPEKSQAAPVQEQEQESHSVSAGRAQAQASRTCARDVSNDFAFLYPPQGAAEEPTAEGQEPGIYEENHLPDPQEFVIDADCVSEHNAQSDISVSQSVLAEAFGKGKYDYNSDITRYMVMDPFRPCREQAYASCETLAPPEGSYSGSDFMLNNSNLLGEGSDLYSLYAGMETVDAENDNMYTQEKISGSNIESYQASTDSELYGVADEHLYPRWSPENSVEGDEYSEQVLQEWEAGISMHTSEDDVRSCTEGFFDDQVEAQDHFPDVFGDMDMDPSITPFLQGRTFLLGMHCSQGGLPEESPEQRLAEWPSGPTGRWQIQGSLEDAEAEVAKEFQKKWYPVKH
ncbi:hypothetical protein M0805_007274 [Coniferiporia weirii]|nr:hypothetical protein M0805_007274 [Coniferiporia weirii]